MRPKLRHVVRRIHPVHISNQLRVFLKDETISGKLILGAAVASLIVVNSPLSSVFYTVWETYLTIGLGSWSLSLDLKHWINEGLMALFFLVVGLEIKRELVKGELKDRRTALLPVGAAVGGMLLPALLYMLFNQSGDVARGWGIPIATDIAFAVAVLTVLGKRVPNSLKIFLLTLAIVDDIGAIAVIALFYAEIINYAFLTAAIVLLVSLIVLRKKLADNLLLVSVAGVILWVLTYKSGIHASIVGAAMGLIAPIAASQSHRSAAERVEHFVLPFSALVVLPLFAFVNAGFMLSGSAFTASPSVIVGITLGLVVGKSVGIVAASWLLIKIGAAKLPDDLRWSHIFGVGLIAGVGFTVSIFIADLAFGSNAQLVETAKAGIFIASVTSALLGVTILRQAHRRYSNK